MSASADGGSDFSFARSVEKGANQVERGATGRFANQGRRNDRNDGDTKDSAQEIVERFFNRVRPHSSLGYLTHAEYEANIHHHRAAHAA